MEIKRKIPIVRIIFAAIQLIAQVITVGVVLQLNMLPMKYFTVFAVAMLLLAVGNGLFLFLPIKGNVRLWRKILSCVLAVLVACGCLLIAKFAHDAYSVVSGVSGNNQANARNTYVLVLDEDPAQSLKDVKGYRFGVVEDFDVEHTQQMIAAIEKATGETVSLTNFAQAATMVDALYNKEIDAMIMSGVSASLLIEREEYEDLFDRTRILHTESFETNEEPEPTKDVEDVVRAPFIMYISGSDTRSNKLVVSRSDVNILAVVNPNTKQILLLNTPRDYYVPNPAGKGALDKLTHCGNYGVNCSMEALEGLYNAKIDYYGQINFSGFEKLIDAIGGVTVYSDEAFKADDVYFQRGENTLNGEDALKFARERYHVSGGDNGRGRNQMKVIKAVIEKMTSSTTLISNYADILGSIDGMFATSLRAEEISNLVKMQLNDMATWNIQSFAVVGTGDMQETYSAPGENLYVMWPNEAYVAHAANLIQKVIKGDTLSAEDLQVS